MRQFILLSLLGIGYLSNSYFVSDDFSSIISEEIRRVIPNLSSISVDDNRKLLVDMGGKHACFKNYLLRIKTHLRFEHLINTKGDSEIVEEGGNVTTTGKFLYIEIYAS